jgi:hypothetical protein
VITLWEAFLQAFVPAIGYRQLLGAENRLLTGL